MKLIRKEWQQFIPISMHDAWEFFSRPENLDTISPDDMKFKILSDVANQTMYEGMLIEYKVAPIAGIHLPWVTEITRLAKHKYFIDEQRYGPYEMWHHEHHFEKVESGVLMTDILYYKLPLGRFGKLIAGTFVSNKIEQIFTYRKKKVEELFG